MTRQIYGSDPFAYDLDRALAEAEAKKAAIEASRQAGRSQESDVEQPSAPVRR